MRIGFDAKRLFFNGRGLGVYSRSTVGLLARYAPENEYLLFSPRSGTPYGRDLAERLPVVTPSSFPALWRSYFMGRTLRRHGIDLYHGLCHEVPADIRRSGVRSVVTMHDLIFVRYPRLYSAAERMAFNRKYLRSCRLADRIIAISQQTRRDLIDLWRIDPQKIDVVYQGCSPRFARKPADAELDAVRARYSLPEQFILSVGAIEERKNLGVVLRAMAEHGIDCPLVAVGSSTPYADTLKRYAAENGLQNRVRFLHTVPFDDLPAIYRSSSVMVYPSRFEGFGIPILEALSSGTPCITTRGGVFAETGGEACRYTDPDSPEQMAEALNEVLYDSDLRRRMISLGKEHAARFSETQIARNLTEVYRRTMEL